MDPFLLSVIAFCAGSVVGSFATAHLAVHFIRQQLRS